MIAELLKQGRLQQVQPDPDRARALISEAKTHLKSARAIADSDPDGAYSMLYDASRKAVTALMTEQGYRATNRPGAHMAIVAFAEEALAGTKHFESVSNFDRMRRKRNASQYDAATPTALEVEADLKHAKRIVVAVAEALKK